MTSFTNTQPSASPASASPAASATPLALLLAEFVHHLAAGDAPAAAALWDVPALILGDEHVHGPLSRDRLAEMLADAPGAGAVGPGSSSDVAPPQLRIERVEWKSQRVAAIEARWPRLRRGGILHGIEAATFLVRSDEFGHQKIRGLVLHAAKLSPI